ncbi:hypothetical protein HPT25_25830 [Bacillus sp. BRMEA1]|uniref:hypothetical protein n=1 Tax=Neobacillus endophyticus TaxID=2738405 RepID=UPI00156475DE|nr:hypothetical protein [Neobacillus endophyticus]NRD80752.1 hypothetical protein [Neobacillus endophyticus]
MKKLKYLAISVVICLLAFVISYFQIPKAIESITFFPIDQNVTYKTAETSLKQTGQTIDWKISSTLDRKAYLRQDAGLLFANGRLSDEVGRWTENTSTLTQEKPITPPRNSYYQSITFHHAELHEKGGRIFSSQAISEDHLYVIKESQQRIFSFKTAKTSEEERWQENLTQQTERMLQFSWNKGVRYFSIPLEQYQAYPLNDFNHILKTPLPGYSLKESANILGRLWEGLYKNYFLGIKKQDGSIVSPIGSTIPLILLAKNKSHLLVLTETANGEPILLRQNIPTSD